MHVLAGRSSTRYKQATNQPDSSEPEAYARVCCRTSEVVGARKQTRPPCEASSTSHASMTATGVLPTPAWDRACGGCRARHSRLKQGTCWLAGEQARVPSQAQSRLPPRHPSCVARLQQRRAGPAVAPTCGCHNHVVARLECALQQRLLIRPQHQRLDCQASRINAAGQAAGWAGRQRCRVGEPHVSHCARQREIQCSVAGPAARGPAGEECCALPPTASLPGLHCPFLALQKFDEMT